MQPLTPQGQQRIADLASRYGVTTETVMTMLQAVVNGNGSMAQFYCAELGGGGQWMRGGMTMIGDMFNDGLKAKVNGLCSELSDLLASQPFQPAPSSFQSQSQGGGQQQQQGGGYPPVWNQNQHQNPGGVSLFVPPAPGSSGSWWPGDLGFPSATGSQNDVRYAYFSTARRLAVEVNGRVSVYDTLDHLIGGFGQQQGSGGSITFTSQYGTVNLLSLPIISGDLLQPAVPHTTQPSFQQPAPRQESGSGQWAAPPAPPAQESDIFAKIERLAELRQKGVLTEEEFGAKKAELLSRL